MIVSGNDMIMSTTNDCLATRFGEVIQRLASGTPAGAAGRGPASTSGS